MAGLGWLVLFLLFVDEVLAAVAIGIGGSDLWGLPGAVLGPVLIIALWWTFASPKAPLGGPVSRPVVKVAVFGVATGALWATGHPGWALAFLGFSVTVNAVAQLRFVQDLVSAGGV